MAKKKVDKNVIQVFAVYDGKTKRIGEIKNRYFLKKVEKSKHMIKSPPAWGIDCIAFDEVVVPNADVIWIYDKESGKMYKASVALFRKHMGTLNRDFGKQYFLTLDWWNTEKPKEQVVLNI